MSTTPGLCRWCRCINPAKVTAAPAARINNCERLCPCHMDERRTREPVAWEEAEADRIFEQVWQRDHV